MGCHRAGKAETGKKIGLKNISILSATPINWPISLRNTPPAERIQVQASDPSTNGTHTTGSQSKVIGSCLKAISSNTIKMITRIGRRVVAPGLLGGLANSAGLAQQAELDCLMLSANCGQQSAQIR